MFSVLLGNKSYIYDNYIPIKHVIYKQTTVSVIRPVILYGAECWTVRKKEEQILEKTQMRMLRRIKGVTLRDRVKSVDIRKELGVSSIQEKVRETSLR